mgnify:CR=1 FL=1
MPYSKKMMRTHMSDRSDKDDTGTGLGVATKTRDKTKKPQPYRVLMLNDDYTPMEFVVAIIQEYFNKDRETATQIMLKVHRDGKGMCGVYPKDIASTKVELVLTHARKAGHPLQCVMEEA